jgi:hypothetical protein
VLSLRFSDRSTSVSGTCFMHTTMFMDDAALPA